MFGTESVLCLLQNFVCILLVIELFGAITYGAMLPSTSLTLEEVHLVRCLTHISHRYFSPGRRLVISSPATYRDVQLELIAEFHRTAIWPVVINVDGDISIPEKSNFIDRVGCYIILLPDNNIWSVYAEMAGLIEYRKKKFTNLWSSEVRFVVARANEFSVLHQILIFYYFSKFRIYNVIFVSKVNDLINKEYCRPIKFNDVDTGMKLVVYSWFPYQSKDRCTDVSDITL